MELSSRKLPHTCRGQVSARAAGQQDGGQQGKRACHGGDFGPGSHLELRDLDDRNAQLIQDTIPAIAEVLGFAEESSRVVAVAPDLAAPAKAALSLELAALETQAEAQARGAVKT